MTFLVDKLIDCRDVYSQQFFHAGEVCNECHVTLKANVQLEGHQPNQVLLQLKAEKISGKSRYKTQMRRYRLKNVR